jgi:hypothetical protein
MLDCDPLGTIVWIPMSTSNNRTRRVKAGFAALFIFLVATIIFLAAKKIVTVQMAGLMFVALLGLYFGFGVLIAVYRFVAKLE